MYIWCADVQTTGEGLLASSGAYEDISSAWDSPVVPSACGRSYVIVRADQFNDLANAYNATLSGSGTTTPPAATTGPKPMDWTSTSMLLQLIFVAICALAFAGGIKAGDRT